MDLAAGCRATWVLLSHCGRNGAPKLLERCRLPLTASGVVTRIFTDRGTFEPMRGGLRVIERDYSLSPDALQAITGAKLIGTDTAMPLRIPAA